MINRLKLGAILLFFEVTSWLALSITPRDDAYYIVAGCFSLCIIFVFGLVGDDKLVEDMELLGLISLFIQFFGYISYHLRFYIELYNYSILILLSLQFIRLFIVRNEDGGTQHDHWFALFHRRNNNRH
jgi:hypothetical protein